MHTPCIQLDADPKDLKSLFHLYRHLHLVNIRNERGHLICAVRGPDS